MTKIFAITSNAKEGDEKPKEVEGITVSSATPQATFYPVTLPISSVVARKRCGTSHLVIILLSLMTISVLFYMMPDLLYRRVHHLVSSKVTASGSASPWGQRSGRFDEAEDARVLPKLDSFLVPEKMNRVNRNGNVMLSGGEGGFSLNENEGNAANTEGEVKQPDDSLPNRFETMKAIATLLKIPGVQQVAVVQNNGRIADNAMMKPEIIPDVQLPSMESREGEFMNYRRVLREWLLRREMFRRGVLAELERERQEAAERKMSQFMMELQLKEQQQERAQIERMQSVLPVFAFARMQIAPSQPVMWMNNGQPPLGANQHNMPAFPVMSPSMTGPRIPPMQPYMITKQEQEQQQPAVMPVKLMQPQVLDREVPVFPSQFGSDPEKPNTLPLQIRDDTINRLDMEQKKIPVPVVNQPVPLTVDGTPDRDTIFKELRSRAEMQQQMSQTILPAAMVPPLVAKVAQPPQVNADEIFRELQHQALRMQIEQDRVEAEQRAEKEKNADTEVPVVVIADALPRQAVEAVPEQTSEEFDGASNAAEVETTTKPTNPGGSLASVQTSLNDFEKGFPGNEIINSLDKEQQIVVEDDSVKPESESSNQENTVNDKPATGNDEVGLVVKPDEFAPQINFVQEPATTEAPSSMDMSGKAYPKLFKLAVSSGELDDTNGSDMLDTPVNLLTPQIQ